MVHKFLAYSLANELELNKLATILGMDRKYRWEEPMVLTGRELPITGDKTEEKYVYLFSFGSVVFINLTEIEVKKVLEDLNHHIPGQKNYLTISCIDTYSLEVVSGQPQKITNDYATVPEFRRNILDMISVVIAKSVALERIEITMESVFDEVDEIVQFLAEGKLAVKDKRTAQIVAKVLNIQLGTLSYIMVLDKPDITWYNILADEFYIEMTKVFELIDRYEDITHKTEVLKSTIETFSNLAHAERAARQELMIIYLILFEILITFYQLGHKYIVNFLNNLFK